MEWVALPTLYPEGAIHHSPGSRQQSRTLGNRPPLATTLKGLHPLASLVEPRQGSPEFDALIPGCDHWERTLGFEREAEPTLKG